jgi:hypothetical protein
MPEVSAAELRKLRALESRIVTANETLRDVRAKRNELRREATEARRELRDMKREATGLEEQVSALVAENARMAAELDASRQDLEVVTSEAATLRSRVDQLTGSLERTEARAQQAERLRGEADRARARLERQVATLNEKIEGGAPPELAPEQLSAVLGEFVDRVAGRTGLEVTGTRINLKVGFSGRGGGSIVVPSLGTDREQLPELHDVQLDLTRGLRTGLVDEADPG